MDELKEAALSARIGVLENALALLLANFAVMTGRDPASEIDRLRVAIWDWQPQAHPGMSEDHPPLQVYRQTWEERIDALFDRAQQLAALAKDKD